MKNRVLKQQNYQQRHTKRAFQNKLRRKVLMKQLAIQKTANNDEKLNWNNKDVLSSFLQDKNQDESTLFKDELVSIDAPKSNLSESDSLNVGLDSISITNNVESADD